MNKTNEDFALLFSKSEDYLWCAEQAMVLCSELKFPDNNPFTVSPKRSNSLKNKLAELHYNYLRKRSDELFELNTPNPSDIKSVLKKLKMINERLDSIPDSVRIHLAREWRSRSFEEPSLKDIPETLQRATRILNHKLDYMKKNEVGRKSDPKQKYLVEEIKSFLKNEINIIVPKGSRTAKGNCILSKRRDSIFDQPSFEALYIIAKIIEPKITRSNIQTYARNM